VIRVPTMPAIIPRAGGRYPPPTNRSKTERRIKMMPPFFLWTRAADQTKTNKLTTIARIPVVSKFGTKVIAGKHAFPWQGGPIALINMPPVGMLPWSVSL
jgi:hypothetical protein